MIGICKNEHGWYISKHNKQLGVKYYKTLTEVMPVAYAEEYSSRSNEGSIQRNSKSNYQEIWVVSLIFSKELEKSVRERLKKAEKPEKSMWKSNLRKPICQFGGRVVQEQHCKWLSNTETKAIIRC